jgi:hypothetical protein
MNPAKKLATLILIGVAVLTISIIVIVRARTLDGTLLAYVGILGGFAIIVNSLPTSNGKDK